MTVSLCQLTSDAAYAESAKMPLAWLLQTQPGDHLDWRIAYKRQRAVRSPHGYFDAGKRETVVGGVRNASVNGRPTHRSVRRVALLPVGGVIKELPLPATRWREAPDVLARAGPLVDVSQAWSAETDAWIVLVLSTPEVGDVPANEELPLPVVVRVVKAISGRPLAVADRL